MSVYPPTPRVAYKTTATMHAFPAAAAPTPTRQPQIANPPSDASLVQGPNNSLIVTWTTPPVDSTHGAAIGFNLQFSPSGAGAWTTVSGVSSPYTLSGLAAGAAFDVQLQSTNAAGGSAWSSPITLTTAAAAPNTPSAASLAQGAGTTLTVSWAAPSADSTHNAATGFNLRYSPSGTGAWTIVTGATSPCNLTGLPPGMAIDVQLQGVNAAGTSAWSATSTLTTSAMGPFIPNTPGAASLAQGAGSSLIVTVVVNSVVPVLPAGQGEPPGIAAPTGTAKVCLALLQIPCNNIVLSQTVTLTSPTGANSTQSAGTVTFTNLPAGQYFLSAVYAGDSNWGLSQVDLADQIVVSSLPTNPSATTTTLTITPSSISGTQLATVTATVTGAAGATVAPTGTVSFYDNNATSDFFILNTLVPAANGATASFTAKYSTDFFWNNGANQIVAVYSGDANYQASSSTAASIQVTQAPGDFTLAPQLAQVTVASGGSATAGLNLGSINQAAGTVSLSCTPSSAALGCSISPTSVTANGAATATLTVNAFVPAQAAGVPVAGIGLRREGIIIGGFSLVAMLIFLGFDRGRRRLIFASSLALFCILAFQAACGGGSGGGGGGRNPPPPSNTPTPAGTYSVVVTAAGGGTIHNVKIAVVVQ